MTSPSDVPRPPPAATDPDRAPELNYLGRDYAALRETLLSRLSLTTPQWRERDAADLGVTLVEAMAYLGDLFSYHQDAVATESHLQTARLRTSVTRHLRLTGGALDQGCNARVWVDFQVKVSTLGDGQRTVRLPSDLLLTTRVGEAPAVLPPGRFDEARCLDPAPIHYVTLHAADLHASLNRLDLACPATGDHRLERGAIHAELMGEAHGLEAGSAVLFEQIADPDSGQADQADPRLRHVVRLSAPPVRRRENGHVITRIEWFVEDALPFDLPVQRMNGGRPFPRLAIARGNLVLADHGEPHSALLDHVERGARYEPRLPATDLTVCAPFDARNARREPAALAGEQPVGAALAAVKLLEYSPVSPDRPLRVWQARHDLLASDRFAADFVVEGEASAPTLRFGDDVFGRRPAPDARFEAIYRTGSGKAGDLAAERLAHLVTDQGLLLRAIASVRNPLPSFGAREPETIASAKRLAPARLRRRRVLTRPADLVAALMARDDVRYASSEIVWNGLDRTVILTVQPTAPIADWRPSLAQRLATDLGRRMMLGYQIQVNFPRLAPVRLEVIATADGAHQRARAHRTIVAAVTPFFDPAQRVFGAPVANADLARLLEALSPQVSARLERLGLGDQSADGLAASLIPPPDVLPTLDPEHGGRLTIRFEPDA